MPKLHLNPNLFLSIHEGELMVWDYKAHQEFQIELKYLERLLEVAKSGERPLLDDMDYELLEAGVFQEAPFEDPRPWGWDKQSHIFHYGTRDIGLEGVAETPDEWAENYINFCKTQTTQQPNTIKQLLSSPVLSPSPNIGDLEETSLWTAFKNRKTCRSFYGTPISQEKLMTLLYAGFSEIHGDWVHKDGLKIHGKRKASPSGGGVHPIEAYVFALRVDGLTPGIYHYCTEDDKLYPIKMGEFEEELVKVFLGQYYLKGISAGVMMTACFERSWWKYTHSRAYRVVMLDAGHVSQTCLLTATSLGLQTWMSGAFHDSRLEELLEIPQDSSEYPILFIGVGYGDTEVIEPLLEKTLATQ